MPGNLPRPRKPRPLTRRDALAQARGHQIGALLDEYLHTLPPRMREAELQKLMVLWSDLRNIWYGRMESEEATEMERLLCPMDWGMTLSAMWRLLFKIREGRAADHPEATL